MNAKVLTIEEYEEVRKIKKKYNVNRVLNIKAKENLKILEIISSNGIFRAYGKSKKEAFKNSKKILKKYF